MARRGPRQDEAERTWRETHRRHRPEPREVDINIADPVARIAEIVEAAIARRRAQR